MPPMVMRVNQVSGLIEKLGQRRIAEGVFAEAVSNLHHPDRFRL